MTKTKNKSVMDCVKEFIAANPKFHVKQVRDAFPDKDANQINTAVWKLTNLYKKLRRVGEGQYELTDVNNSQPVTKAKPKAKAKRKYVRRDTTTIKQLQDKLHEANQEIIQWSKQAQNAALLAAKLQQTQHDLNEALVLIRYLENKLFIAIQFDAKNNGSNT